MKGRISTPSKAKREGHIFPQKSVFVPRKHKREKRTKTRVQKEKRLSSTMREREGFVNRNTHSEMGEAVNWGRTVFFHSSILRRPGYRGGEAGGEKGWKIN